MHVIIICTTPRLDTHYPRLIGHAKSFSKAPVCNDFMWVAESSVIDLENSIAHAVHDYVKRDNLFCLSTSSGNTYYMQVLGISSIDGEGRGFISRLDFEKLTMQFCKIWYHKTTHLWKHPLTHVIVVVAVVVSDGTDYKPSWGGRLDYMHALWYVVKLRQKNNGLLFSFLNTF